MKAALFFSVDYLRCSLFKKKKKRDGSPPVTVDKTAPQPFWPSLFLEPSQLHPLWCQGSCTASLSKGEKIPWLWLQQKRLQSC